MTTSEKRRLLKWNTFLWLTAMILPGVFHVAFASSKFPWPVIIPCLLFGPLLASNRMLSKSIGEATEEPVKSMDV